MIWMDQLILVIVHMMGRDRSIAGDEWGMRPSDFADAAASGSFPRREDWDSCEGCSWSDNSFAKRIVVDRGAFVG